MGDGNSLNVEQEPFNIEAVAKQLTPAGPTLLTSFLSVFKKSNRKQSNAAEAAEHVKVGAGLPSASKPLPILRKRCDQNMYED
ncbi:hypothetical protein HK104_003511 [Borealophlyctis nickersoniae]|nr:hypothetical protein HK104_003511 [Borealophlyctis nickersoniae]